MTQLTKEELEKYIEIRHKELIGFRDDEEEALIGLTDEDLYDIALDDVTNNYEHLIDSKTEQEKDLSWQ